MGFPADRPSVQTPSFVQRLNAPFAAERAFKPALRARYDRAPLACSPETYIRSMETAEKQYLRIIDLPLTERPRVMRELSIMGITAGSLFPDWMVTAKKLRERFRIKG